MITAIIIVVVLGIFIGAVAGVRARGGRSE
jgi:hypothetical protein